MVYTEESVWFYFTELPKGKVQCKHCSYNREKDKDGSTGWQIKHLKSKHAELNLHRIDALKKKRENKENELNSIQKITSFITSKSTTTENESCPIPAKKFRNSSGEGETQTINECFGKWTEKGESTKKIDKLITEMISVDIMPLNTVEKMGFKRLMNFCCPQYKIKTRQFYTRNVLNDCFEKLFNRAKNELAVHKYISITTDIWTSKHGSLSILSATAHFIRGDAKKRLSPVFLVAGAAQIKGSHTGQQIAITIENALQRIGIKKEQIHLVMRDAQSSMRSGMNLFGVDSQDCFLHKLQLCVGNGLAISKNFGYVLEKMKKVVRKIRKSHLQREYLHELQSNFDLPHHILTKNTEVRWNSTYQMSKRFLDNKIAIEHFVISDVFGKPMEGFTDIEWDLIKSVNDVLEPIFFITKELEKRTATISAIIPVYRSLTFRLNKLGGQMAKEIAMKLDERMSGWETKKKLVVPTILDPKYKMQFFEPNMRDFYRNWLIEEICGEIAINEENVCLQSENVNQEMIVEENQMDQMLEEFAKTQENSFEDFNNTARMAEIELAKQEIDFYLAEPRSKIECFEYWTICGEKWPRLLELFKKFNSPPVGSHESERLFSTAGAILNDFRNKLTGENLEKLIFLHHNLPIFNFEY